MFEDQKCTHSRMHVHTYKNKSTKQNKKGGDNNKIHVYTNNCKTAKTEIFKTNEKQTNSNNKKSVE